MRYILILFMFLSSLYGKTLLEPLYVYKVTEGLATDVLYEDGRLYIASDSGRVDIYDTKSKKQKGAIKLSKIKDFMGDAIDSKIFTLDFLDKSLLILSQDSGGYSRVHLYEDKKLTQVISGSEKFNIIKAKFINRDTIVLGLISNDIISYNIKTKKKNWTIQASMSKFSNFALNNKRSIVAIADESGEVNLIDTKTGKKLKKLSGQNVDNLFDIAFAGDTILTGGQDRRAGVYNIKNGSAYHKVSQFFVYGVGLSPSGKIAAYSCDMDDNVEVFNTVTRESLGRYKSTKKVVNGIFFINEKEFFVNSSAKSVGYYRIK